MSCLWIYELFLYMQLIRHQLHLLFVLPVSWPALLIAMKPSPNNPISLLQHLPSPNHMLLFLRPRHLFQRPGLILVFLSLLLYLNHFTPSCMFKEKTKNKYYCIITLVTGMTYKPSICLSQANLEHHSTLCETAACT